MFTLSNLALFAGSSILLILAPGPDIIFTITQGVSNGKRAGVLTALGLAAGNIIHTLAAAFGVSIIFKTSQAAFIAFKTLGALYLFYLAIMAVRRRRDMFRMERTGEKRTSGAALCAKGFLMNVLNPKVALFFLAFLPQFVNGNAGHVPVQIITLGLIFIALVVVIFGTLGYFAGSFAQKLLANRRFSETMGLVSAAVFIGLGVKLALSGNQ
jgi:threonine/homoserine/homoserine lactone efflux protein